MRSSFNSSSRSRGGSDRGGRSSFSRGGGRSSGGRSSGGRDRSDRGGSDRRSSYDRPEMFETVCDQCGKDCKVPFRPSGDKPVYCSECFETVEQNGDRGGRFERRDRSERNDRGSREDFAPKRNDNTENEIRQLKEHMGSISAKLDKLIRVLTENKTEKIEDSKEEIVTE